MHLMGVGSNPGKGRLALEREAEIRRFEVLLKAVMVLTRFQVQHGLMTVLFSLI